VANAAAFDGGLRRKNMSNYNNRYAKDKKDFETQNPKIIDEKIKSGKIGGIYCLFGDEEYMIDYYIKKIMDAFAKDSGDFDCAVFDADNFDINLFRDVISSYPVVSEYKTAVLKNADSIKFKSGEKEELIKILSDYKDDINEYACVIFKMKSLSESGEKNVGRSSDEPKTPAAAAAPSLQKRAKENLSLAKFLKENANLFEFKENPPASLIKWLKKIAASEKIEISDENAGYILNRTEPMMYPLKNELDKLINYAKSENRNIISRDDIELLISKKTEMEAFELTNAILDKKYGKAIETLNKLKYLKEEPVAILGQIARYFYDLMSVNMAVSSGIGDNYAISKKTGLHEYKIKLTVNALRRYQNPSDFINKSLSLCRDCDVKLKSTQIPDFGLIENLLFNIAELK